MSDSSDGDFEAFVRARHHALLRFAYALVGDLPTAEDLVQGALERTGARWALVMRRPGDPEAYVRKAILNGSRSRWRSQRHERLVPELPESCRVEPVAGDHNDAMWQAMARLPTRQRAVVVLRFYEDLSVHETAHLLQCSEGTVKSQTFKAIAALRSVLKDEEQAWN